MSGTSSAQHGFTLIEVVLVLAILGVLGSIAIPKFVDLREQAMNAATKHIHGSFTSAINIHYAEWALRGSSSVRTNGAGWPVGAPGGPKMTDKRCAAVWTDVLTSPPPVKRGYNPNTDGWGALASGTSCIFVYQPDSTPLRMITYDTADGAIDYLII